MKGFGIADPGAHGRLSFAHQDIVEVLFLGWCGNHHGHAATHEAGGGAADLALGLAAGQVAVTGDDDCRFFGHGRAADVRDAKAGPGFLSGRLPDGKRGLDALAEHKRFTARQAHGGALGPAIHGLVGAFDHFERCLLPLGRQIDLLDCQHLSRIVGGQCDHGAEPAPGMLAITDAVRRRRGDATPAQIGKHRRRGEGFGAAHDLGDLFRTVLRCRRLGLRLCAMGRGGRARSGVGFAQPVARPVACGIVVQVQVMPDELQPSATAAFLVVKPAALVGAGDFHGDAALAAEAQLLRA